MLVSAIKQSKSAVHIHITPLRHHRALSSLFYTLGSHCVLSRSVMSDSLRPHRLRPPRLLCPWGFSRQEYWSGLPCPPPGFLSNPGIQSRSPTLQGNSWSTEPPGKLRFSLVIYLIPSRVYMSVPISQFIPLFLSLLGIHTFLLYICVSSSALQIGSAGRAYRISCWIRQCERKMSRRWLQGFVLNTGGMQLASAWQSWLWAKKFAAKHQVL